jgi:hypothetical protein
MIYLCRQVRVIKSGDSLADALVKVKGISKSGRAKDTILNKVYEAFAIGGTKQTFEATLSNLIDEKVAPFMKLPLGEYQRGEKIPSEVAT